MSAPRFASILAAALCALAPACKSTELTQVIVVVDSDSDDFARVKVRFTGLARTQPLEIDLDDQPLPRHVTLVHDGGPLGPFGVTVEAFAPGNDRPVLVEPRTRLFFERGRARVLRIDLLHECIGACEGREACFEGPHCVPSDSDEANELSDWNGRVVPIDMRHEDPDAGTDAEAGAGTDAETGAGTGGGTSGATGGDGGDGGNDDAGDAGDGDAGDAATIRPPVMPALMFPYEPSNFDPEDAQIPAERTAVELDCGGVPTFDSTDGSFSGWCGDEPFATTRTQAAGGEAALLVMNTLSIAAGTTLRLVGSRPVILAVYGDAEVLGAINASAAGATPGAGGNVACAAEEGEAGIDSAPGSVPGSGGGGGGGFGSAGGDGGDSNATPSVSGGSTGGTAALSPLRGGCPGGQGGLGDGSNAAPGGAGGGAVQISAAGRLEVVGWIAANGGGGGATTSFRDGGGGGGSGGAILLEGNEVNFDADALVVANGGGGGAGNPTAGTSLATPGADGGRSAAGTAGGSGPYSGGDGGFGAARVSAAGDGQDADISTNGTIYGAGGGGGGGIGRIVVNQGSACIPHGTFSPELVNECEGACTSCVEVELPSSQCRIVDSGTQQYAWCMQMVTWSAAQASCASVGLRLVHIDDAAEQAFVEDTVGNGYTWLDARDNAVEGEWRWEQSGVTFFSQQTGQPVASAYNSWAPMQPGFDMGEQDCMATSDIGWFDYACNDTEYYLCEP